MNVLLVDKIYRPLRVIRRRDALKMIYLDKANFIMAQDVIMLKHRMIHFDIKFSYSKYGVYIRDGNVCQYCGKLCGKSNRTIDHIIPVSRGGVSSFENCVAACKKCNEKKQDKMPYEVNMKLLRQPYRISYFDMLELAHKELVQKFHTWLENSCQMAA